MVDRLPPGGRYPAAQLSQPPTHDECCRLVAGRHRAEHERLAEQVGAWLDPETAAAPSSSTADPEEIEAVWRSRETPHKRDLVYEAERVVASCPPLRDDPVRS